jgi:tRNA G18 (ribose-2'-O)-methylase SpoU
VEIIRITDARDPRITHFTGLRERDVLASGHFIAEGKFILERLLAQSRFEPVSALLLESRLAPLEPILAKASAGFRVHLAAPDIMNAIAGHDIHRGILALGRIPGDDDAALDALAATARPLAVAAGIGNGENLGSIFRNAAGLAMAGLIVDRSSIHPLSRRALRVSMGTALHLPWARVDDGEGAMRVLEAAGYRLHALTPARGEALEHVRFAPRAAFLFGEEAHGLAPSMIDRCVPVRIPMASGTDSLNVAATSAIVFDAIRRALSPAS